MEKEVEYISVELLVRHVDTSCFHTLYVVAKEYNDSLANKDILFAEACDDLVSLEKLGIDCSLRCCTYSVMEDSEE